MLEAIKEVKTDHESFHKIKDDIFYGRKYDVAMMNCYICNRCNHISTDCPYAFYKPDLERLIKKDNFHDF